MDSIENGVTATLKRPESPVITAKIGKTTYEVVVHFSQTSTETMSDKIMRLIQNEYEKQKI